MRYATNKQTITNYTTFGYTNTRQTRNMMYMNYHRDTHFTTLTAPATSRQITIKANVAYLHIRICRRRSGECVSRVLRTCCEWIWSTIVVAKRLINSKLKHAKKAKTHAHKNALYRSSIKEDWFSGWRVYFGRHHTKQDSTRKWTPTLLSISLWAVWANTANTANTHVSRFPPRLPFYDWGASFVIPHRIIQLLQITHSTTLSPIILSVYYSYRYADFDLVFRFASFGNFLLIFSCSIYWL